jgi:hypothetical protein
MTHYVYGSVNEQHNASIRRQADARTLLEQRHWRGAMYLLGYAVECRLKACLMEKYGANTLGQLEDVLRKRFSKDLNLKDHSIERLLDLLEIRDKLMGRGGDTKNLRAFQRCNEWTVNWRYRPDLGNKDECQGFFEAVQRFLSFIQGNS